MNYISMLCAITIGYASTSFAAYSPQLLSEKTLPPATPLMQVYCSEKNIPLSEREKNLISHLQNCVRYSFFEVSSLSKTTAYDIEGMSCAKVRHLLNNLCTLPNTRYLEIGTWKGSTFVAALVNNQSTIEYAVGIDDWSEFGGPRAEFENNLNTFLPSHSYHYEIYSQDCFAFQPSATIKAPINIYLYDGNHSAISQEKAFTHYNDVLDDVFIALVDDWNEESVKEGTFNAFNKLNYEVLFEVALPGPYTLWWNGLYAAVVRKAKN